MASATSISFRSNRSQRTSVRSSFQALSSLGDIEFLQAIDWDRSADVRLKKIVDEDGLREAVMAISESLQTDGQKRDGDSGCGGRTLWSMAAFADDAGLVKRLGQAAGHVPKSRGGNKSRPANKASRSLIDQIESLIDDLIVRLVDPQPSCYVILSALEVLAFAGGRLRSEVVFPLWRQTLTALSLFEMMFASEEAHDPTESLDRALVIQGEIPFVAGVVFGGVSGANDLMKSGRRVLTRALAENIDGDGSPRAEIVQRLPLWLAPLIRASLVAQRFGERLWTNDQQRALKLGLERAIALCRADGKAALSHGLSLEPLPVLTAAAELFELRPEGAEGGYLQSVQRVVSGQAPRRVKSGDVMTMPSNQSDWARFALLRSDWSVGADSVAVAHHRTFPQLDVSMSGIPLIHGDWTLELRLGDATVELAQEWSCVCWQSDPDADYIELQMCGPKKLRVERIIMLSRKEKFLLLADSVSGVPRDRIEYRSTLPLAANTSSRVDGPTREVQLTRKGLKARVFPLALAQDRVVSSPHALIANNERMSLHQVAQGEGLFAPVLFDWNPNRSREEAQWRSLTVTEAGKVITPDLAAGHRLKLGDHQLLVFRSLKTTGESRAVLGHHTRNETVIAKFGKKGDVDPILMVESGE